MVVPSQEISIRTGTPVDLNVILAVQQSALGCAQWSRSTYAAIFAAASDSNPQRAILCAWRGERLAGFVVASLLRTAHTGECELENMAVDPSQRRQGIGQLLVASVQAWCGQQRANSVRLEVRADNAPAVRLYERLGFVVVGRRPDYYSQPVDDALQMTWIAECGAASSC